MRLYPRATVAALPRLLRWRLTRLWRARDHHRAILLLTGGLRHGPTWTVHPAASAPLVALWGRLGCHGYAVDTARSAGLLTASSPPPEPGLVALLTALAATGEQADLVQALDRWQQHMPATRRVEAAQSLGRHAPKQAHRLIEGLEAEAPWLAAALALACSPTASQREALRTLMASHLSDTDEETAQVPADCWLLAGQGGLITPLEALNRHFAHWDLAAVALVAGADTPAASTLTAAKTLAGQTEGPLVSVLIPAYNTARRIGPAIRSMLAQTHRRLEVIVVDDASTDDTFAMLQALAAEDARVRPLQLARNAGAYVARNLALAAAQGEFVTVLDSDDWAHPQRLERQLAVFAQMPQLMVVSSHWVRLADDGRLHGHRPWPIASHNPASPLFRRLSVLAKAGIYEPTRFGADTEYQARLRLLLGREAMHTLPQTLTIGAWRPGSLTHTLTPSHRSEAMNPARLAYWQDWTLRHLLWVRDGGDPWPRW